MKPPVFGPGRRPVQPNHGKRAGSVLRGMFLLGTGRSEGLDCFGDTREAFLSALTPPLAFLVVRAILLLSQTPSLPAVCLLLLLFSAILLPPVLSQLMAALWTRNDRWLRYATASTWCMWLALPAALVAMVLVGMLGTVGVSGSLATGVAMLLLGGYLLWLQWFLAWKGLRIGAGRAALTVIVLSLGSLAVMLLLRPFLPLLQLSGVAS